MGRRKIEIAKIPNERHRQVTFGKRKSGLIKKATELSILCEAEVAVLVFNASDPTRVTVFSSHPLDHLLQQFSEHKDPEVHTNDQYFRERAMREAAKADSVRVSSLAYHEAVAQQQHLLLLQHQQQTDDESGGVGHLGALAHSTPAMATAVAVGAGAARMAMQTAQPVFENPSFSQVPVASVYNGPMVGMQQSGMYGGQQFQQPMHQQGFQQQMQAPGNGQMAQQQMAQQQMGQQQHQTMGQMQGQQQHQTMGQMQGQQQHPTMGQMLVGQQQMQSRGMPSQMQMGQPSGQQYAMHGQPI